LCPYIYSKNRYYAIRSIKLYSNFNAVCLAVGFVVGTIIVSGKLGPKRSSEVKGKNFECGIESVGNARIPFSVKYSCSYIICFV
jgi:NADH:ubiquinone oxidoreductase subunit 3 (subunit A)